MYHMNKKRYRFVVGVLGIVTMMMVGRLGFLVFWESDFLRQEGAARAMRTVEIPVHRGIIYDRRGEALSVSAPVVSVWMDPQVDAISSDDVTRLAYVLDIAEENLASRIENAKDSRFLYLARRLNPEIADRVRALNIQSVRMRPDYRRYYPMAEPTAHIVGVTNIDDEGQEGVEFYKNQELLGKPGLQYTLQAPDGRKVRDLGYKRLPVYGRDVVLTIDARLQYLAYSELKSAVAKNGANAATLLMCDVDSGDVLVMTSYPSYNPNDIGHRDFAKMRNRAVVDSYPPGSTVKPFVMIAALESGKFSLSSLIDTNPGRIRIGSKVIEDPRNYGTLSLTQVLAKSSQVGILKLERELHKAAVFNSLQRAGFSDVPNVGLPGENIGEIDASKLSSQIGRAILAYGYGLTVSPVQLLQSYFTLATGGVRRELGIYKDEYRVPDYRVFDQKTVQTVLSMMENVVTVHGTAGAARVRGIRVAGKTGTVRRLTDGKYDDNRHIAFFVGIAPANNPKIVTLVVVTEPSGLLRGGGTVAAPIFSKVVTQAIHLIGLSGMDSAKKPGGLDAA